MRAAHEWSVWSTRARVCVTEARLLDEAVASVRLVLDEIDDAANRFRDDSEISRLRAGTQHVSPLLADLLRRSLQAAESTDGAVDPTVGATLVRLGYDRSIALIDHSSTAHLFDGPAEGLPVPGWRTVGLIDDLLTLPKGVRLDLGATAKAAAADRAAATVAARLGCGVLVSLGGDIATNGPAPIDGWQVRIRDHDADPVAHVSLDRGWAVATSSTVHRTWGRGPHRRHHLVDPTTGLPVRSPWRTVSVAAPTCLEANTASTAGLILGTAGADWLRGRRLPARLVDHLGRVHLLGGWPTERVGRVA
ncbi:MAG: FAD:protein FMN transferase [Actinobacteria bacterium]|nr:FAD:protein FMN transferase [Actinomycetota bacterium]